MDRRMSFKIGRLAKLSGFDATLLRAWERRHGLLRPERLSNGFRVYNATHLELLKRIRALLDQGCTIGDIARMDRAQLGDASTTTASVRPEPAPATRSEEEPPPLVDVRDSEIGWSVLDALPCAVIVTDVRGRVTWVNRGVPVLCGYDLADLHGLTPGSVLQGEDTDSRAVSRLRASIAEQRPCSVTLLNYHKSGDPYLARVEVSPLGIGTRHSGFVATVRRVDRPAASRNAPPAKKPGRAARTDTSQ